MLERSAVDRVVVNGRIATMEAPGSFVEALAIAGGRIVARGSTAEIRALAPHAELFDCEGRTVLPGLIDSHCHPDMHGARIGRWHDLSDAGLADKDDLLKLISRTLSAAGQGAWFVGFRYDELKLGGYPSLAELDAAGAGHPVFLYRRDAHLGLANSAALKLCGYGEETPDPPFGRLDRDPASGTLTGLLRETAAHHVVEVIQRDYTADDFARGLKQVFADYARYGITSVHNSLASTQGIVAYQKLRQAGELRMRVGLLASGREEELIQAILRAGWRTGFGDEWVRLIGVEWCPDCSTSGRTAAYYEPYGGTPVLGEPPNNCGMLLYEQEDFDRRVVEAHKAGLMVSADGVGDRGIDFVLNGFEAALAAQPTPDHRMRVEHCCYVTPKILERLKRLGAVASSATGFAYDLGDAYIRQRGEAAMSQMWPHRSLNAASVAAPGHSDAPVCHPNPFRAISALVTRRTERGASLDAAEAIEVWEAIRAYTVLGAYAGKEEWLKGDLGLGKLADLCVLDRDVFTIPKNEIAQVGVVATFLGGEPVYLRGA